jgi:hypothetical protein
VQVDGEGRWAKPLEEPQVAYARRAGRATETRTGRKAAVATGANAGASDDSPNTAAVPAGAPAPADVAVPVVVAPEPGPAELRQDGDGFGDESPDCPKCGGRMWDNRLTKRNPKAPDFKCRDRSCDGVVWPPRSAGEGPRDAGRDAPRDGARAKADAPAPHDAPAPEPAPGKRNGTRQRAAAAAGRGEPPLDVSPLGASDDDDLPF